jgi:hypothetical protein
MFGVGELAFLFVFSLLPGIVGAVVAGRKGRSRLGWFLLCALLPPVVVIAFFVSPAERKAGQAGPP